MSDPIISPHLAVSLVRPTLADATLPRRTLDGRVRCPSCGMFKPRRGYYRNVSRGDGLNAQCSECDRVRVGRSDARKALRLRLAYFRHCEGGGL